MISPTGKNPVGKNRKRRFSIMSQNLDALLAKAEERMRDKGDESCREQILLMTCQCKCKQVLEKEEEKERFKEDVKKVFANICAFCKGHDLCPEYCVEELPFP